MIALAEDTKLSSGSTMVGSSNVLSSVTGTTTSAQPSEARMRCSPLHRPSVVRHVLEDVAADDDVESLVRELDVGHIQVQIDIFPLEIGGL